MEHAGERTESAPDGTDIPVMGSWGQVVWKVGWYSNWALVEWNVPTNGNAWRQVRWFGQGSTSTGEHPQNGREAAHDSAHKGICGAKPGKVRQSRSRAVRAGKGAVEK